MFIKIFVKIGLYLILVIIHQIRSFFILLIKKVIGKIKDEFKEKIISEFVGLKSKVYSIVGVDNEENKKQKKSINMLLKTQDIKNLLMFCLIREW